MNYRTKTYIAADWTGDRDAIDQLHKWNESRYWSLSFSSAHDLTQARDSSLKCSIKASLKKRLDVSKTFVLIVGDNTLGLRSGGCQYCQNYYSTRYCCTHGYSVDYRSYIEYECDKAVEAGIKIVVLYNSSIVNRSKCPQRLRNLGTHVAMCYNSNGQLYWDYNSVKDAIQS